jgi:hypothetical protein
MGLVIVEVYDALLAAGAPEDKARKAAGVLANYDTRLNKIEAEIVAFRAEVRGEFALVKWMLGFGLAGILTLIFKAFA